MIERVLLTPDELKAISKGSFIVMKTGTHSMQTRLQLFLNWSITFWEPYTVLERANRAVAHVNRVDLKRNHLKSDKAEEAAEHRDYLRLAMFSNLINCNKEFSAEARYVIAAADRTFLTASISVGANLLDVSRIVHARLDASNSTGRVTNWNTTTAENRIIPIFSKPVAPNIIPNKITG